MSSKQPSGAGLPISLVIAGIIFFCMTWGADSSGSEIVYWNRGAPITRQALNFAAGGFIVVGLLLFILRRGQR